MQEHRLTDSLNESPSEKEGKSMTKTDELLAMRARLNESPSEKEGKLSYVVSSRIRNMPPQ